LKYVVGIDLGTTNSAVAYAEIDGDTAAAPELFEVPQVTAPGNVEPRPLLPSFLYLAAPGEFPPQALDLPWEKNADRVAGQFAHQRGAEVPARLVSSAKSWLSHPGVDRSAAILPWGSPSDVPKLSPVAASAFYLAHVRQAWDSRFPKALLAAQDVLLTVPASFDAVARDLTTRASKEAGLPEVTILEEPQAAFYAWIDAGGDGWREAVRPGDLVLVCDIGGGTTDLSLIAVRDEDGRLGLERVAVGDHILLGGDNMDLALAYRVRERLAAGGTKLDEWQFRALALGCREAKERLLAGDGLASHPVAILGRGRKVVGGSLRAEIERGDVDATLVEGFFPRCRLGDRPERRARTALRELGLPYAADPAVTRHLAEFLGRQGEAGSGSGAARPTALLFNGGVMRAPALCRRVVEVLESWFPDGGGVRVLAGADPEYAVARGAAYYGLARRGRGVRIRGGTARSYYVGVEASMPAVPGMPPPIKALCVVPQGLEEGSEVDLPAEEFGLVVGEPTEFRFLGSSCRRDDRVGTLAENWEDDIEELAPLVTTLDWEGQEGATIPVHLQARVNEVGVLELWCVSRDGTQRWKLEFNVRSS
jgi:hypothetical protein